MTKNKRIPIRNLQNERVMDLVYDVNHSPIFEIKQGKRRISIPVDYVRRQIQQAGLPNPGAV